MTREEITTFVARWQDATARRDTAAPAELYAEDSVLESPTAGTVAGRHAIVQVFSRLVRGVSGPRRSERGVAD